MQGAHALDRRTCIWILCSSSKFEKCEEAGSARVWHWSRRAPSAAGSRERGCGFLRTALRQLLPLRQRLPLPPLTVSLSAASLSAAGDDGGRDHLRRGRDAGGQPSAAHRVRARDERDLDVAVIWCNEERTQHGPPNDPK